MKKYRGYKQDAFEFINKIREELGMEPIHELPKGKRKSPYSCPVAQGLKNSHKVIVNSVYVHLGMGDSKIQYILPTHVGRFVERFDEGKYPELELDDYTNGIKPQTSSELGI